MKKFQTLTVIALLSVFTFSTAIQISFAQSSLSKKQERQRDKAKNKQYREKMQKYKSEGWSLSGSSSTLEVAWFDHQAKLNDKNKELVVIVSKCKSINVCKQFALNNAMNYYAASAGGNVKGRIGSLLRGDANMPQNEVDKFIAGYETQVKAEIGGALTASFSVVKDNGDGTKSYESYFIVNEEEASLARDRALKRSLLETKIAVKEAEEISKFVNEGFDLE
ncbi:MAG: hypothetical protein LBR45_03315 [Bacteroidales bacterium]|jgi:hypothetical protein|nr:hypothetical protein [Bacteroidales bacterium]